MKKIKNSVDIMNYVDDYIFYELLNREEFKDVKYDDLLLLASEVVEKKAKEYRRDFSFLTVRRQNYYIKNVKTKEVFKVRFIYKSTFNSDGYDLINITKWDEAEIEESRINDSKDCLMQIRNLGGSCYTNTYVLKIKEDEEYETISYSNYFFWIKEEKEEEENK